MTPAAAVRAEPLGREPWPGAARGAARAWLLLAELGLLAAGFGMGRPWLGVLLGLAVPFFLLAFRSPDAAWALIWIAFPFSIEVIFAGGNAINLPTEPMMAIALGAWGLRSLAGGTLRVPRSRLHLPLALVAGAALLSVALSAHPAAGLKAWIVAAAYAAFGYLYMLSAPCDSDRRDRWVKLVVVTGAFWGLYGAVRVIATGAEARLAYGLARPFFPEHGTYAAYLAMILPLSILMTLERRGRARLTYSVGTFLIALGITLSFTRAAWISIAVVLPLMLLEWRRGRGTWRGLLLPLVALSLVASVVMSVGAGRRLSRHAESVVQVENVSNLERVNRWMAAWEMTKDSPWIGVGYGTYPMAYPQYRRKVVVTESAHQYMGPHSEPLRLLSETGAIGFVAALWLLGAAGLLGVRTFRHATDPRTRALSLGIVAGLATYAVHGVFNSYLGYDKVTIPFWMGLGAIAAMARRDPPGRAS